MPSSSSSRCIYRSSRIVHTLSSICTSVFSILVRSTYLLSVHSSLLNFSFALTSLILQLHFSLPASSSACLSSPIVHHHLSPTAQLSPPLYSPPSTSVPPAYIASTHQHPPYRLLMSIFLVSSLIPLTPPSPQLPASTFYLAFSFTPYFHLILLSIFNTLNMLFYPFSIPIYHSQHLPHVLLSLINSPSYTFTPSPLNPASNHPFLLHHLLSLSTPFLSNFFANLFTQL